MKSDNARPRCPGQDMRFWKPEDIFTLKCPHCGNEMEFWKDEPFLICKKCSNEIKNPRIDLGCAKWCKFADQCLGRASKDESASPVIEKVKALLSSQFKLDDKAQKDLEKACKLADNVLGGTKCDPCVVKTSLVIIFFSASGKKYIDGVSEILGKAGINPEQQEKISAIVKAVVAGTESDSEEYKAVKKLQEDLRRSN
ncbi:MAG TPA: hypothetical protein DCZ94_15495 [Lentisphaeria bacterium]|nr:MAG: hypothetical protein A2X48_17120 [Lentisphaerae bacterium GWF2_49_21]HBC88354.1 hypothetical protein [Lentisphaeria bacterium]